MDIGQMGGGDALLANIDAGVRACKVRRFAFLSCLVFAFKRADASLSNY